MHSDATPRESAWAATNHPFNDAPIVLHGAAG
jgi:hypothetical protein